jgi:hypothetical protein
MVSPVVEDSGGYLVVYLSASEPTPCGTPKRLSRRFYIFMTGFVCLLFFFFFVCAARMRSATAYG